MNTNKSESKTNQRAKQQDLAAPKLVLAAVSPEAQKAQPTGQTSLSAQPLTATEFGEELERQRQQKLRKTAGLSKADFQAEALVDTILAGDKMLHERTARSSWALTCIWIAMSWSARSMAGRPNRRNASVRSNSWPGPRNRPPWPRRFIAATKPGLLVTVCIAS